MTFEEIWAVLCRKRPHLNEPGTVEIRTDELKKLLNAVYKQGFNAGDDESAALSWIDSLYKAVGK